MTFITARFGTTRGLARLGLSYVQVAFGHAAIALPDPAQVRRLVFVCHGNICRSAYADVLAQNRGLRSASFGLSTSAGKIAHPPATEAALQAGVDLTAHRTTRAQDFAPMPGDLLLAMEVRQLHRLAENQALSGVPRTLLGLHVHPRVPHLHDPYELDADYMVTCLRRIDAAIVNLATAFPGALISG